MQSEERTLISGLFERLQPYEAQPRDPEAEQLIASLVARQPSAPYLLAQTVLVQEQALKTAQARIADLESKVSANANAGAGFLSSAPNIGPWGAKPAAAPVAAPMVAPMQAPAPAPQPFAPQGGGFLRSALTTAAGVAGGALLFEGIRGMFGGHQAQAASPLMPPDTLPTPLSSAELAQDDGASDDYDMTDDNSGFDDSLEDI
jgi:uncharacterized protein